MFKPLFEGHKAVLRDYNLLVLTVGSLELRCEELHQ